MELLRQLSVFSPEKHKNKRIDIIGVGATGSYVAWLLSKIGFENLHFWDDDVIVEHNIPNQLFFESQIGKLKIEAMANLIQQGASVTAVQHAQKANGTEALGEIIFLLTDTMASRKQIWQGALKYKLRTHLMIETRMGADSGRIYAVNPSKPSHIKAWENASQYSDEEAERSACGASISIACTAGLIASIAVWQLIKWFKGENLENEILVSANPWSIVSRVF